MKVLLLVSLILVGFPMSPMSDNAGTPAGKAPRHYSCPQSIKVMPIPPQEQPVLPEVEPGSILFADIRSMACAVDYSNELIDLNSEHMQKNEPYKKWEQSIHDDIRDLQKKSRSENPAPDHSPTIPRDQGSRASFDRLQQRLFQVAEELGTISDDIDQRKQSIRSKHKATITLICQQLKAHALFDLSSSFYVDPKCNITQYIFDRINWEYVNSKEKNRDTQ